MYKYVVSAVTCITMHAKAVVTLLPAYHLSITTYSLTQWIKIGQTGVLQYYSAS